MENIKGGSCATSIASLALTYGGAFLIGGPVGIGFATGGVGLAIALVTKGVAFGGMLASCRY